MLRQKNVYAVSPVPSHFGLLDLDTGEFSPIGPSFPSRLTGIANVGGMLFTLDEFGTFFRIDPATGETTELGDSGISSAGFAGSPNGSIYALDQQNMLFRLDSVSGAASLIGIADLPAIQATSASSQAASDTAVYATYWDETHPSTLYKIDPVTAATTVVGPTAPALQILGSGFEGGKLY